MVNEQSWAYARIRGGETAVVVLNNGAAPADLEFGVGELDLPEGESLDDRLGEGPPLRVDGGRVRVSLSPHSAAVYLQKR